MKIENIKKLKGRTKIEIFALILKCVYKLYNINI